jgi:carbonic anhydrase
MSSDFIKNIDNNKLWVESQLAIDKEYFKDLAKDSNPIALDWMF